jgi:exosortase
VLAILGVALIAPALVHAVEVWLTTEEFSFGLVVVPVAAALVWWHRLEFRRAVSAGANGGLIIVLGALALFLLAFRADINALSGLAVVPLLWGSVVFLAGWRAGRVLAFPIGFLAFGLALYRGLLDTVGFTLQRITAAGAADLVASLGIPVVRDGLTLYNDKFAFVVAQPCSGMSSLVSLLALASLWVHLARGAVPRRLVVLLSVLPLVIVANTTRVALVMMIAWWMGQDEALGFFHGASSLVLFGLALGGMLLVSKVMGCRLPALAR